jgi:hypothetical protein
MAEPGSSGAEPLVEESDHRPGTSDQLARIVYVMAVDG